MPNRTIKETIRTSKNVNALTDFQFRLWVYLITFVDDKGVGSADPDVLKSLVFPRRPSITREQILTALERMASLGMITLFKEEEESCFCFPKFQEHQDLTSLKRFKAPTLEEVKAYAKERGSTVDPVKFYDYFCEGGWRDSEGKPVKNWKQKLMTWEKYGGGGKSGKPVSRDTEKRTGESKKWNVRYTFGGDT